MGCLNQRTSEQRRKRASNTNAIQSQEAQERAEAPINFSRQPSQMHQFNQAIPPSLQPRSFQQNNSQLHQNSRREQRQRPIQIRLNRSMERSEISEQISQTLTELQRRRAQPQQQNQPIQIVYHMSSNELLFFLFQALRTQDMDQRQNLILFLRLLDLLSSEPQARGLSEEQINSLERKVVSNSEGSCAVCQSEVQNNQQVLVLPCKHFYHPDCIGPWLSKSDKCPVCRGQARKSN